MVYFFDNLGYVNATYFFFEKVGKDIETKCFNVWCIVFLTDRWIILSCKIIVFKAAVNFSHHATQRLLLARQHITLPPKLLCYYNHFLFLLCSKCVTDALPLQSLWSYTWIEGYHNSISNRNDISLNLL